MLAIKTELHFSIESMEHLDKKSLLDLPDEAIELIMDYLSFKDLSNLGLVRNRLGNCAKRVAKKKPFSKYYRNNIKGHRY